MLSAIGSPIMDVIALSICLVDLPFVLVGCLVFVPIPQKNLGYRLVTGCFKIDFRAWIE